MRGSKSHKISPQQIRNAIDKNIVENIAKRELRSKEVVKMMFSCPEGITNDSVKRLPGYTNKLVPISESPYADNPQMLPFIKNPDVDPRVRKIQQKIEFIKIQKAIEEEKKKKAEIKLEILSLMESNKDTIDIP